MIDQAEAKRRVLANLNRNEPPNQPKYKVTRTVEKPFGWVFFYDGCDSTQGRLSGNVPLVVERDGTMGGLYTSGESPDVTMGWYETEWLWRTEYATALELAKNGQYPEAEARLHKCLDTVYDIGKGRKGHFGERSNFTAKALSCMNSLGEVQLKAGNISAAEATIVECKRQLDQWSPVKQVATLDYRLPILQNMIALRTAQKRVADADVLKREMAMAYRTARNHAKAQEVLEQQLEKRIEMYPQGHPAAAQTLTDLSMLKADLNQFFQAQLFLDAAMKIWEPLLLNPEGLKKYAEKVSAFPVSEMLPWAGETMDCYASYVLMREGKRDEAVAMRQRAKQLLAGALY